MVFMIIMHTPIILLVTASLIALTCSASLHNDVVKNNIDRKKGVLLNKNNAKFNKSEFDKDSDKFYNEPDTNIENNNNNK